MKSNPRNLLTMVNSLLMSGLMLLIPLSVLALPGDRDQPINIQADKAIQKPIPDGERTTYIGSVKLTQGSLLITGERLIIDSKNREVTRVTAFGSPAHFQQQSDPQKQPIKADANKISYSLASDTIVLEQSARVSQEGSTVSGERIYYDLAREQVQAKGTDDGSSRVHMVLEPPGAKPSNTEPAGTPPEVHSNTVKPGSAETSAVTAEGSSSADGSSPANTKENNGNPDSL